MLATVSNYSLNDILIHLTALLINQLYCPVKIVFLLVGSSIIVEKYDCYACILMQGLVNIFNV